MDAAQRLQRHALEGLKTAKIEYIHKMHSNNPTMNKTELKYSVGLGISPKIIAEYWRLYVDPNPVYVIRDLNQTLTEEMED